MPRYYLSSLDSHALKTVRACEFVAIKYFDTGKECAVAEVDPPIPGQVFGLAADVTEVLLAVRHEGDVLSNIREFPCFVHVARPVSVDVRHQDVVVAANLENLARGNSIGQGVTPKTTSSTALRSLAVPSSVRAWPGHRGWFDSHATTLGRRVRWPRSTSLERDLSSSSGDRRDMGDRGSSIAVVSGNERGAQ